MSLTFDDVKKVILDPLQDLLDWNRYMVATLSLYGVIYGIDYSIAKENQWCETTDGIEHQGLVLSFFAGIVLTVCGTIAELVTDCQDNDSPDSPVAICAGFQEYANKESVSKLNTIFKKLEQPAKKLKENRNKEMSMTPEEVKSTADAIGNTVVDFSTWLHSKQLKTGNIDKKKYCCQKAGLSDQENEIRARRGADCIRYFSNVTLFALLVWISLFSYFTSTCFLWYNIQTAPKPTPVPTPIAPTAPVANNTTPSNTTAPATQTQAIIRQIPRENAYVLWALMAAAGLCLALRFICTTAGKKVSEDDVVSKNVNIVGSRKIDNNTIIWEYEVIDAGNKTDAVVNKPVKLDNGNEVMIYCSNRKVYDKISEHRLRVITYKMYPNEISVNPQPAQVKTIFMYLSSKKIILPKAKVVEIIKTKQHKYNVYIWYWKEVTGALDRISKHVEFDTVDQQHILAFTNNKQIAAEMQVLLSKLTAVKEVESKANIPTHVHSQKSIYLIKKVVGDDSELSNLESDSTGRLSLRNPRSDSSTKAENRKDKNPTSGTPKSSPTATSNSNDTQTVASESKAVDPPNTNIAKTTGSGRSKKTPASTGNKKTKKTTKTIGGVQGG